MKKDKKISQPEVHTGVTIAFADKRSEAFSTRAVLVAIANFEGVALSLKRVAVTT